MPISTIAEASRGSFYRWYDAYERAGLDGLENQGRVSRRHWNRIPDSVRKFIVEVALVCPDMTPRELAWHITDTHDYFVSESSVYRILKAHDLITSPQFTVLSAADKFQRRTEDLAAESGHGAHTWSTVSSTDPG